MDIREELEQKLRERGAGDLSAAADQELYHALLELVAQRLEQAPRIQGDKKLYYVSAEFLVGKLLSNNLINLGLYAPVKEALAQAGRSLAALEELEAVLEPSKYVGRAPRQTQDFLNEVVAPVLERYRDVAEEAVEINV